MIIILLLAVNYCYTLELIKKNVRAQGIKGNTYFLLFHLLFFFFECQTFFLKYLISTLSTMINLICPKDTL